MSLLNLQLNSLGINISDRCVKIIELAEKNKKIYLKAWNQYPLDKNIVTKGEIKNKQKLIEAIQKAIKESKGKVSTSYANVSLPENKSFFNTLKIYPENEKNIKETLEKELEKNIPIPVSELRYDYEIISQNKKDKQMTVSVSAIPSEIAKDYEEVLASAGLRLNCLEVQSQSTIRAIFDDIEKEKITLVLDLGYNNSSIALWHRKAIRYTTEINFCGEKINKIIGKKTKMEEKKVEKTKKIYGLENKKNKNPIFKIIEPEALDLIEEIKQSITFYRDARPEEEINFKIILTGGSAKLKGLEQYIEAKMQTETIVANPFQNIKINKNQTKIKDKGLEMLVPIGLSLKDIKNVSH